MNEHYLKAALKLSDKQTKKKKWFSIVGRLFLAALGGSTQMWVLAAAN
jgi:hypothetical protein